MGSLLASGVADGDVLHVARRALQATNAAPGQMIEVEEEPTPPLTGPMPMAWTAANEEAQARQRLGLAFAGAHPEQIEAAIAGGPRGAFAAGRFGAGIVRDAEGDQQARVDHEVRRMERQVRAIVRERLRAGADGVARPF